MSRRWWIATLGLWPGLPQIWVGEEGLGLLISALFAGSLNLGIIARLIWTEALDAQWATFFLALAASTWVLGFAYTLWWLWRCHPERHRTEIDRLFREAVDHYLLGQWNEARRRLERVLALDENDADALLQLATLYVRTDQHELARRSCRQCQRLEGGTKWRWEIERLLERLGPASDC